MYTIGLDLHKLQSQLCISAPDGTIQNIRIATSRERFAAVLGKFMPGRVLVDAG